jgi:hypothetical protein
MAIYVSGLLCQYALEERDHVLTAVKIVDQIVFDLPSDIPPDKVNILNLLQVWALIFVKSDGPEDFELEFTGIAPNGQRVNPQRIAIHSKGGSKGHQIRLEIQIDPRSQGLWWFEIAIAGNVVLKMPLLIAASDQSANPSPSVEASE